MNSTSVGLVVAYALSEIPALSGRNAQSPPASFKMTGLPLVVPSYTKMKSDAVLSVFLMYKYAGALKSDASNSTVALPPTLVAVTGRRAKPVVLAAVMLVFTLTDKLSDSKSVLVKEIAAVTVAIGYSLMQIYETLPLDFVGPVGSTHLALLDIF